MGMKPAGYFAYNPAGCVIVSVSGKIRKRYCAFGPFHKKLRYYHGPAHARLLGLPTTP